MRFRTALALYFVFGFIGAVLLTEILRRDPVHILISACAFVAQGAVWSELVRSYLREDACKRGQIRSAK